MKKLLYSIVILTSLFMFSIVRADMDNVIEPMSELKTQVQQLDDEAEKEPEQEPAPENPAYEGSMTLERIHTIVTRLDPEAKRSNGSVWRFKIINIPVIIVTDEKNNRMRILAGIKKADELSKSELLRLSQANFDSALDARYAIAQDTLWGVYIHPLRALHDKQFISAIGQTVNIVLEYGKSYSSGALIYGGGDSSGIIEKQLIQQLQEKGLSV